jgi:FkbH-like protein/FkbM family methyltransferase
MRSPTDDPFTPWLPASAWRPADLAPVPNPGEMPTWLLEFPISLQSLPYLADHGFHDMVVLPGAFHIELARQIHRELFHTDAVNLRRIEFERPVILTADDVTITVRVEKRKDGLIAYELFEATSDSLRHSPGRQPCARLEIDANLTPSADKNSPRFHPDEFLQHSGPLGTAGEFYRALRDNGNQYGSSFQTFAGISRSGPEATGRFVDTTAGHTGILSPPLLDAASQLLSAFHTERGQTFILKSIDRLTISSSSGPGPWWAHASRTNSAEASDPTLVGAARIVDAHGALLWELSGVTLAFIDRPGTGQSASSGETRLCVAATFTTEPLEDALRFWGEHFGRSVLVEFAPYNQVFQQLLDPTSTFRGNRTGINALVLGLEDWLPEDRHALRSVDPARAAACFGARPRTILPNGLEIVHLNRYETDYVYQEIFEDQSYLRHDIQLADGDTVIDIGANIGLFSLFVMSRCKSPAIYTFEPSPRVFDLLQANCAAYGEPGRVHAFNRGVAEKSGQAQFTFYEHSSVFSSFHPDEREDRAAVEAVVRNVMKNELSDAAGVLEADVDALTTDRLRAETIDCALSSVSDIIRENGLQKIHLLKIDAEKSEIGILRGIEEAHWPLIEQIVIEIHDRTRAAVETIEAQLTGRGFRCAVVEEKLLEDSGLFNIYATRRPPVGAAQEASAGLNSKVEEFSTALDAFVTSNPAPLVLAIAPRPASELSAALEAAEDQVLKRAARHPQVQTVSSHSILARHPVRQLHDAHSRQLGHMPFTPEGYVAIGTALSRAIFSTSAPSVKVIVLDCDHTLWQGLCGEDGPAGIAVTAPFRHLQEFMVRQSQAGILLALCSKNQEADVLAVFDQRTDLPLRRELLAAWRINWQSKSDNLRALAAQLNLGLDSFVFIDDNPVECAAVRAGCPEVIVLQLPADTDRIPAFLDSLWIFDRTAATREDHERSQWYRANSDREESRSAAPSLRDFLDGLQLRIEVAEPTDEQLARVAQLTLRTNQFNLTAIRRSEGELRALLQSGARCLVASVSDRFGDYGLVGAMLYTTDADRLSVDTLLLSCRALGKGVEHRMLAELASCALRDGKSSIALSYCPTDRNEPAWAFIQQLKSNQSLPKHTAATLEFSAASLAALRYAPEESVTPSSSAPSVGRARAHASQRRNLSAALQKQGDVFTNMSAVVAAMESSRQQAEPTSDEPAESEPTSDANALERPLAGIWKKALGRTRIGINENFFDAGGTSLKAVVVVAMIRKELKKNVSIVALFESPTIALLAARLDDSAESGEAAASAESRGRQRRIKVVKRRAA